MASQAQTHFLVGTLGAALLIVVGLVIRQTMQEKPKLPVAQTALVSASASTSPSEGVEAPIKGVTRVQIQAEEKVTAGTTGHPAKVVDDPGVNLEWSITGGTIVGDNHGSSIVWNAGSRGDVVLSCAGKDYSGKSYSGSFGVLVRPPAEILTFESSLPAITLGMSAKLGWSVRNVKTLTLDPGGINVLQVTGPGFEVKPTETTTYVIKATNEVGTVVSKELTLTVVKPPAIVAFRIESVAGDNASVRVVAEFSGGKAVLNKGEAVLASSETSPLTLTIPRPANGTNFSLVVTNKAGSTLTSTCVFKLTKS